MSDTRRNVGIVAGVVILGVGAWWLLAGKEAPKPVEMAKATTPAVEETRAVPTGVEAPAVVVPSGSGSGLPPGHFEEKKRMQEEANEALLALEEEKYAKVDFSASRPGAPAPRVPVQGKNEEEMTMQEKAAQVDRLRGLIRDRRERTAKRIEEARKTGDAAEVAKLEAMDKRFAAREVELERRSKLLKGEPLPPSPPTSVP